MELDLERTTETQPPPGPEGGGSIGTYAAFSKTVDHGGGGSSTVTFEIPIPEIDDVDEDDFVLAIIPVLEDSDYVFEHVRVTIAQTSVHDPRNP